MDGTEYDYVTRTSANQGILRTTGFVNKTNINPSGTWSLGLLSMDFFYRRKPWYAGQFVRKIIPKLQIPEKAVPFFTTILNKQKPILLSVLVRGVDETFKNISVKLPKTADGKIDFAFMESFTAELETARITELEAARAAELSAYLKVSGLDNCDLTIEEENALKNYPSLQWGAYNLEKLFGKSTRGKRLISDHRIAGTLPFVTAGEAAQGISAYIGNKVAVFEKNTTTIDMFGSAKYRNYRYGADDHVAVVHTEAVPMKASIFLTAAIHKAAHTGTFDYGRNFYAKDADALTIMLPTKDGKPDYDAMAALISAAQKLVIQDAIHYADQNIEKTKAAAKRGG